VNKQLESLLSAMPQLAERTDDVLQQACDLVQFARKLGMLEVAACLEKRIDFTHKWYGPKPLHPEQRSGEIHLFNSEPDKVRYVGWKSKRAGEVAYGVDGNIEPGKVPVFVLATEFEASGQLTERCTIAP
jgi:hypothetical protein